VAALSEAARALGQGATPSPFPAGAPLEFAPVMSAFERMTADIRRSQAAIEEARQRTAQVLAKVATGVLAVDPELRVTLANPRAAELLGVALDPGDMLPMATGSQWREVWEAVAGMMRKGSSEGGGGIREREFDVAGGESRVRGVTLGLYGEFRIGRLRDAARPE